MEQKCYCMKCKEEIKAKEDEKVEQCQCGSKNFIYGNKLVKDEKGFSCGCDKPEFKMTFHMNANPKYVKNYTCQNCGTVIGMETYYESPYM